MSRGADALIVTLTGQLPFILIVSAVLALAASFLLLFFYRRAVVQSMRRQRAADGPVRRGKPQGGIKPPQPARTPTCANFLGDRFCAVCG
jgi:phosphate/sulfate permease